MKRIGFKNFRRFEDFPPIDLAPITIFVGENNAGKSTVVKGTLALYDFLKNEHFFDYSIIDSLLNEQTRQNNFKKLLANIKFNFNTSYLAHIGTFKRAICNNAKDNTITFSINIDDLSIDVVISGSFVDSEAVSGNVESIKILHDALNIVMLFNLKKDEAIITFNSSTKYASDEMFSDYFDGVHNAYTITSTISENLALYHGDLITTLVSSLETSLRKRMNSTLVDTKSASFKTHSKNNQTSEEEEIISFLKFYTDTVCRLLCKLGDLESPNLVLPGSAKSVLRMWDIEYIYAHAVTQTVIYSAKDTNDYLSMTIHEFAPLANDSSRKKFITYWMNEFGIGKDYQIKSVGGEAHIVYITNKDGKKVNLADKGMGSIQLMVLLFKIATDLPAKINKDDLQAYMRFGKTVIMEEPEQNLHPMLQSKLADLFFRLTIDYGYRFIIETHSEYLIRKTQVLVKKYFNGSDKEHSFENNPFKVYYFPAEGHPKDMMYRPDGKFDEEFGKGFFDEATSLAFQVLC